MKKIRKIVIIFTILLLLTISNVQAHGGNITGWKQKNSDKIIEKDGKHYGYHQQDGERHYHEVEWNEEKNKWEIVKSAIYYNENLEKVDSAENEKTKKNVVKFSEKVDGDTAKFEKGGTIITVRFLGIDTPETVHPTKGEEPFGKEASNFTETKLKNATKIELEYDSNAAQTDKYERHLAWIWVDDILLQEELVKNGLAKTYMLQDNYQYAGKLQEAEEEAKLQKTGIWSDGIYLSSQEQEVSINDAQKIDNTWKIASCVIIFVIGIVVKIWKRK